MSCGVVVIRQCADQGRPLLLLLRSFANWDFPKGMQEPGERPEQTALREVCEETTIADLSFPWGQACIDTGPYSNGKIARYFIGMTRTTDITLPANPVLGRPEHVEWRWVTLEEARDLVSPRVQRVLDWAESQCPDF